MANGSDTSISLRSAEDETQDNASDDGAEMRASVIHDARIHVVQRDAAALLALDDDGEDEQERKRIDALRRQKEEEMRMYEQQRRQKQQQHSEQRRQWEKEIGANQSQSKEIEELQRRLDFEETAQEFSDVLCRWTGLNAYEVAFDSQTAPLTSERFNAAVGGLKDVMVLVITSQGYAFGCFSGKVVACWVDP